MSQLMDHIPAKKVAIAGDWHGNLMWAVSAISQMAEKLKDEEVRIVFQLGDFGWWGGKNSNRYRNELSDALEDNDMDLIFIDGNHENHPMLLGKAYQAGYGTMGDIIPVTRRMCWAQRGSRLTVNEKEWLFLGGAASVDRQYRREGESWFPQEYITDDQADFAVGGGKCKVLLCHDRPQDAYVSFPPFPTWPVEDLARSEVNREKLQKVVNATEPELILHGHLHMALYGDFAFDYGEVTVVGFDCDGTQGNWDILDTETLKWVRE